MSTTKNIMLIFVLLTVLFSITFLTANSIINKHLKTEGNTREEVLFSMTNILVLTEYSSFFVLDEDYGESKAGFDVIISSSDLIKIGSTVEFTISLTTTSFSTHTGFWGDVYVVDGAQISSATIGYQFKTTSLNYISGASEGVPVTGLTFNNVLQTKNTSKSISIPNDISIAFLTVSISFSGVLHQTKNGVDQGWLGASGTSSDVNIPVSVDITAPNLNSPPDIQYLDGTSGHSISWTATDDNPARYTIYGNGSSVATDSWISGTPITINIDFLAKGSHNFTILVTDVNGNSANDIVFVTVFVDSAAPDLNSPSDIQYTEGTSGHSISWTATDDYPVRYTIYRNGSSVATDSWISGTPITINIDYLVKGTYNYTIVVTDDNGNSAKDEVIVTVTILAETTPSFEFWLLFFLVPTIVSVKYLKKDNLSELQ